MITAGGENVAPVPIEDTVKEFLPCISNAVLIGDKQKYLSIFLTFKVQVSKDSDLPTDNLTLDAIAWCQDVGSNATKVSEILSEPPNGCVKKAIQKGIDLANAKAISRVATIKKWVILPSDLSIHGGELGPTLKLKRFYFNKKYKSEIDSLYEGEKE